MKHTTSEAAWFARRRNPQTARQTQDTFETWLAANPENAVRYEQCALAWDRTRELAADDDVRKWLAQIDAGKGRSLNTARSRRTQWAIAAAVTLAVGGVFTFLSLDRSPVYQTAVGEQRDLTLPDGSHVTLNTATRIVLRYDRQARRIEMTSGEAMFDVRKDPARPFEVAAGPGVVKVLGTRFVVERSANAVKISVLDGAVALGRQTFVSGSTADHTPLLPPLERGQSASLTNDGRVSAVTPADTRRIQAWQERKLDFDNVPLADAIAEVNRYSAEQLVLGRPELGALRVSGVFRIPEIDGCSFAIQQSLGLRVEERDGTLVVLDAQRP